MDGGGAGASRDGVLIENFDDGGEATDGGFNLRDEDLDTIVVGRAGEVDEDGSVDDGLVRQGCVRKTGKECVAGCVALSVFTAVVFVSTALSVDA